MVLNKDADTIVAQATPAGRGGVGIVRVSGPRVLEIARQMLGKIPKPRVAENCSFRGADRKEIDRGIALFFRGPQSFTGEDVLELQGHGGPVVINQLLEAAMLLGARMAEPGEFSLRAFLNGKIDLFQAEAVADLIHASSRQAAHSALLSLKGDFSRIVESWVESLIQLRMYVEAFIDFPEEEIDFLTDKKIRVRISNLIEQIEEATATAHQGVLLSEGFNVVIAGKPNAGKSSLLNRLSGRDSAIVTDIPGTTRDVLKAEISIDGLLLNIIDTAGLRMSDDRVEKEGIRRACLEINEAHHILWIVDGSLTSEMGPNEWISPWIDLDVQHNKKITILYNKIDQLNIPAGIQEHSGFSVIALSAKTGEGMNLLSAHLKAVSGFDSESEGVFAARARHLEALKLAKMYLLAGRDQFLNGGAIELLSEELRQAQLALEVITGKVTTDDLLSRIFSEFCVGK